MIVYKHTIIITISSISIPLILELNTLGFSKIKAITFTLLRMKLELLIKFINTLDLKLGAKYYEILRNAGKTLVFLKHKSTLCMHKPNVC